MKALPFYKGDIVENLRDKNHPCFYVDDCWCRPNNEIMVRLIGYVKYYDLPHYADYVDHDSLLLYKRPLRNWFKYVGDVVKDYFTSKKPL